MLSERRGPSIPSCSIANILKDAFMYFASGTSGGWSIRNVNLLLFVSGCSHLLDRWNLTHLIEGEWTCILSLLEGQVLVDASLLTQAEQYLLVDHPLRAL